MRRAIVILVILVAATLLFGASQSFQAGFVSVSAEVNAYIAAHAVGGAVIFVSFAALSAILSPFSSVPMVPFAVLAWGETLAFALLLLGWFLGGMLSYAVGRYSLHVLFHRLLPIRKIEAYQQKLSERSEFILVALFRLALPAEVTGLVLGSLRYDFLKYLAATLISEIPFALVTVYAGGAFALNDPWRLALWIAVGSALFATAAALFARRMRANEPQSSFTSP